MTGARIAQDAPAVIEIVMGKEYGLGAAEPHAAMGGGMGQLIDHDQITGPGQYRYRARIGEIA